MEKIILLFTIVFAVNSVNSQSWEYLSSIPSHDKITTISVVNENLIWVCGENTAIYYTTNGGFNWIDAGGSLSGSPLYGLCALDENLCWVGRFQGDIWKTTNGGLSWTMQFMLNSGFVNGIKMFNADFGVSFGNPTELTNQNYQLRRTTNGGLNWLISYVAPLCGPYQMGAPNAWDNIDTSGFWFGSGTILPNAASARVYRTTTGFFGTWYYTELPGTGGTAGLFFSAIAFVNATSGLTGSNTGSIFRTTDGGVTWGYAQNPPGLTNYSCVNMYGFKDASNIIRVVTNGSSGCKMFITTDLGAAWTEETLPSQAVTGGIQHIQFVNHELGFAGGGAGKFYRYGPPIGVKLQGGKIPYDYALGQNCPNPFNPNTRIEYAVPKDGNVKIAVYDLPGREVTVLVDEYKNPGTYSVDFNALNVSTGIYFYKMESGKFTDTKKMLLIK
jgi:photosystem II stability/assembly factor-like uncharacterized protein